jgi:hypothetical protein
LGSAFSNSCSKAINAAALERHNAVEEKNEGTGFKKHQLFFQ